MHRSTSATSCPASGCQRSSCTGPATASHLPWVADQDALLDEIEEFLTGVRRGPDPDRVLATVLFTDIVGSTERAAALGDRGWRELLEAHHQVIRGELSRYRGRDLVAGSGIEFEDRGVRALKGVPDEWRIFAARV